MNLITWLQLSSSGGAGIPAQLFNTTKFWYSGPVVGRGGTKMPPIILPNPLISSAQSSAGVLTVVGSDFGSKAQAAPALMYEDGVAFVNGVQVEDSNLLNDLDPYTPSGAVWNYANDTFINKNSLRYASQGSTFTCNKKQAVVGEFAPWDIRPSTVGGKMYFSMRFRPQFDHFGSYYTFTCDAPTGVFAEQRFSVGEDITFGTAPNFTGQLIGLRDDGAGVWRISVYSAVKIAPLTVAEFEGVSVVGVTSTATTTVKSGVEFVGNSKGSDKLIRYDTYDSNAGKIAEGAAGWMNYSLSQISVNAYTNDILIWDDGALNEGNPPASVNDFGPVEVGFAENWHKLELIVNATDRGDGFGEVLTLTDGLLPVNGLRPSEIVPVGLFHGSIPNISTHGLDNSGDGTAYLGSMAFGEQYIDNTLQILLISDQDTWVEARKQGENQFLQTWVGSSVTAAFNKKGLPLATPLYAYIVNEHGNANSAGHLITEL